MDLAEVKYVLALDVSRRKALQEKAAVVAARDEEAKRWKAQADAQTATIERLRCQVHYLPALVSVLEDVYQEDFQDDRFGSRDPLDLAAKRLREAQRQHEEEAAELKRLRDWRADAEGRIGAVFLDRVPRKGLSLVDFVLEEVAYLRQRIGTLQAELDAAITLGYQPKGGNCAHVGEVPWVEPVAVPAAGGSSCP